MKKFRVGHRVVSLLLIAAMLASMTPMIRASSAAIDADGYLGNVKILNNDESITLPIKVNNFALDGMMFEYLSDNVLKRNSQFFV